MMSLVMRLEKVGGRTAVSSGEQEGVLESPNAGTSATDAGEEVEQVHVVPSSEDVKRESVYSSFWSEQYAYLVSHPSRIGRGETDAPNSPRH